MTHGPRTTPTRAELLVLLLPWAPAVAAFFSGAPLWLSGVSLIAAGATTAFLIKDVLRVRAREATDHDGHIRRIAEAAGLDSHAARPSRDVIDAACRRLSTLNQAASELRRLIDAVESPILATDSAGGVVLANEAAEAFFSPRSERIIGHAIEELFTQADILALHAAAAGGRSGEAQVSMSRPVGRRVYHVHAAPVSQSADQRSPVVVTLRDVTELANAVQLQTDFVANASHELRTPLASIRAAVETLETAYDDPPMVDRLTEMIRANCRRLEELVSDLLDLSRLQNPEAPLQKELVELPKLMMDLEELFSGVAEERRLGLTFEAAPGVEHIRTDRKSLQLILRNLLENSTKFAYEGTTIRVRASSPGGRTLRLEVIDRGVGIPIGQQERIFERFFQVDASRTGLARRRGTGLGLAIVKQAVTALGGVIAVESVWKEGTTMRVDLPDTIETVT